MANYVALCRTNYFRVTDKQEFSDFVDNIGGELITDADGRYGIMFEHCEGGCPSTYLTDSGEEVEFYLSEEIGNRLQQNEVAIIMEVGNEKMRYLNGWAMAVNHCGESTVVNLIDIFSKAKARFGDHINITLAEY